MLLAIILNIESNKQFLYRKGDIDISIKAVQQGDSFKVSSRVEVYGKLLYGYNNVRIVSTWKDIVVKEVQKVLMCRCSGRKELLLRLENI